MRGIGCAQFSLRLHELAKDGNIDRADKVGGEYEPILQNTDEHQVLARIIARYLPPDFFNAALNLLGAE